ncbi:hypothetical protein FDG95_gp177 [Pectobacterium phage vB_PcaM_CBB]|uniref:Putative membrane protein n=1 Tax=Pectobacterium phage vB_PcaM_CBB TaxID=2772511 RepID=A0A1L2CUP2_9CAUD|nr:hypothetical protein FDG95_gp177 [Pectobacterium phage vB_PcaM_CBB]AMM43742.1 putative membrane protein [Pectobacterium phage vB_PcaM_CBB]
MKNAMIVLAGVLLCGVGAIGYFKDLNLWGLWVIAGIIIITTQVD